MNYEDLLNEKLANLNFFINDFPSYDTTEGKIVIDSTITKLTQLIINTINKHIEFEDQEKYIDEISEYMKTRLYLNLD